MGGGQLVECQFLSNLNGLAEYLLNPLEDCPLVSDLAIVYDAIDVPFGSPPERHEGFHLTGEQDATI